MKPLRVLIVDDSADDAKILEKNLSKAGFKVESQRVDSAKALKDVLQKGHWELVVSDYSMPGFDGIAALAIVREIHPEVPFILISGAVGEERAVEAMRAGAADYIMKGNYTRLAAVVERELIKAEEIKSAKEVREALQKKENELRQAQKLESIGMLAGGIAHDFNNILAIILMQSEILQDDLRKPMEATELLGRMKKGIEQIQKSGKRATNLTRQLLAFSRKQVIQPTILNLNSLVADMEAMLSRVVEENIEVTTNLELSLKNVKVDPGHVEQILLNLVVNSRDAMPKGGAITIATENSFVTEEVAKQCNVKPGPHVLVKVIDTGEGIPPDVLKKIFEPFFTTKPVGKGTGLGLSTVYGIVKQNKGLVFVESTVGKGTTFKVYFPTVDEEIHQAKAPICELTSIEGAETILVVEDEDDLREILRSTLKGHGYEVYTADNGLDALNQFKANTGIDLVISDVVMPQLGGADLVKKVREIRKDTKFLFQSGHAEDTVIQNGFDTGQIHFLEKPYSPMSLLTKVRIILDTPQ